DDARGVGGKRAGIFSVPTSVNRPRKPGGERASELLEAGGSEREEARPVIGARERDDSRTAGGQQGGTESNLDGVLPRHAEHCNASVFSQASAQLGRHICLCEVTERVDAPAGLGADGSQDLGAPMTERGHAEAPRKIDVALPLCVDDAAAPSLPPAHGPNLFSVSSAT